MTRYELRKVQAKLPLSAATLRRNADIEDRGAPPRAEPEPAVCDEPVATTSREACDSMRVRVRITAFRVRLLDPDNLCPKYFIDCLRYANCIRDDRPQDITLEVTQEKVAKRSQERTEIELT